MRKPRCGIHRGFRVLFQCIGSPFFHASLAWFSDILLAQPSQSGCRSWTRSFCQSQTGHISNASNVDLPHTGQTLASLVFFIPIILSAPQRDVGISRVIHCFSSFSGKKNLKSSFYWNIRNNISDFYRHICVTVLQYKHGKEGRSWAMAKRNAAIMLTRPRSDPGP